MNDIMSFTHIVIPTIFIIVLVVYAIHTTNRYKEVLKAQKEGKLEQYCIEHYDIPSYARVDEVSRKKPASGRNNISTYDKDYFLPEMDTLNYCGWDNAPTLSMPLDK